MLGAMGLDHPAVDGFLIDDWYTTQSGTITIECGYPSKLE